MGTLRRVWRSVISQEFLRYAVVGGVSFLCDYGVLRLTVSQFGWHYLVGAMAGFCVGLAVNFILAERFVFGAPKVVAKSVRFGGYGVIGLVGLGLLESLMWVQVDLLDWDYRVAKVIATAVGYLWNYLARRVMYKRRGAAVPAPDEASGPTAPIAEIAAPVATSGKD
jgi:putative flippase GtrA